jgi:hypothetical protein
MKTAGITALLPDLEICNSGAQVRIPPVITAPDTTTMYCHPSARLAQDAVAVIYSLGKNAGTGGAGADETHNPNPRSITAADRAFVNAQQGTNFDDQMSLAVEGHPVQPHGRRGPPALTKVGADGTAPARHSVPRAALMTSITNPESTGHARSVESPHPPSGVRHVQAFRIAPSILSANFRPARRGSRQRPRRRRRHRALRRHGQPLRAQPDHRPAGLRGAEEARRHGADRRAPDGQAGRPHHSRLRQGRRHLHHLPPGSIGARRPHHRADPRMRLQAGPRVQSGDAAGRARIHPGQARHGAADER